MNRFFTFALLALSLGTVFGCATSRVPLTQELRTRHNLSAAELKSLQYYNSNTITLRRELLTAGKQVTEGHKLVLKSGQHIEEVVIEAGTPGAAVDVGPDFITVSFEPDTALTFALRGAEVPEWAWGPGSMHNPTADPFPGNPGREERERRREPEPVYGSGNFWLYVPGSDHRVAFAGTWFDAVEESLESYLLIDAEALEEQEESERVLSGVKL